MIKLMKHYAENTETGKRARVHYSRSNLINLGDAVTLYAKTYNDNLYQVFGDIAENNTDIRTDYFEKDKVRIFPDNPLFKRACELAL